MGSGWRRASVQAYSMLGISGSIPRRFPAAIEKIEYLCEFLIERGNPAKDFLFLPTSSKKRVFPFSWVHVKLKVPCIIFTY